MLKSIRWYWNNEPLTLAISLGMLFRLLAVIFSKGYGMIDDHFLVIESSQSWVDGEDYNNWLPSSGNDEPKGHSFFYPGIHYLLFRLLESFGFNDPQGKMYFIRLLHAAFSLLTIYFGYKITRQLGNMKIARQAAFLMALLWFMPFLSVRNMVEIVCIPFLLWGVWIIVHAENKKSLLPYLISGIILGIAFSIRFQTILFAGGTGLALLLRKQWKQSLILGAGYIFSVFATQGIIDILIWGYPFAELSEYVNHNIIHKTDYIVSPWYNYILLILGILIPPVSLFLLVGFFRVWRKHMIIFLPTFVFLAFHSYFPNKQERFILPVLPFFIIAGLLGWYSYVNRSGFWRRNRKLLHGCWIFFWSVNLMLLPVISTTYSKKALVESMTYLSDYSGEKFLLLENSTRYGVPMVPRYYLDGWPGYIEIDKSRKISDLDSAFITNRDIIPRFILFFEEKDMKQRVAQVRSVYPEISHETTIEPGFIDKVMHWLNPVNANQTIVIYRNNDVLPPSPSNAAGKSP